MTRLTTKATTKVQLTAMTVGPILSGGYTEINPGAPPMPTKPTTPILPPLKGSQKLNLSDPESIKTHMEKALTAVPQKDLANKVAVVTADGKGNLKAVLASRTNPTNPWTFVYGGADSSGEMEVGLGPILQGALGTIIAAAGDLNIAQATAAGYADTVTGTPAISSQIKPLVSKSITKEADAEEAYVYGTQVTKSGQTSSYQIYVLAWNIKDTPV